MNSLLAAAGWFITEWTIAAAAFLTASGVVWRTAIKPTRDFIRKFKTWMTRIEESVSIVEEQMKPNSGSTVLDKVHVLEHDLSQLKRDVKTLLKHDAQRDQPGLRYGESDPKGEPNAQTPNLHE